METKDLRKKDINKNYLPKDTMSRVHVEEGLNELKEKLPDTYDHCIDVANMAYVIAKAMYKSHVGTFTIDQLTQLYTAALVHDIGKLDIDPHLLHGKKELTLEDKRTIRGHVSAGEKRLRGKLPKEIIDLACSHHERLNGSGYGLVSSKPRDARTLGILERILAVADVVCAMSENRTYQKALPRDEMIHKLQMMAKENELDARVVNVVVNQMNHSNSWGTEKSM